MDENKKLALAVVVTALLAAGITAGIMVATRSSDEPPSPPTPASLRDDPTRPNYHYTPEKNWVNDPNGLVYYKGEYHFFYQRDNDVPHHINMSWGHAVSTDLVHWDELPTTFLSDASEELFSGSAVVDADCTSGLCDAPGQPVLIAIYTSAAPGKQAQSIASSTDLGRTWTKYAKNPVLDKGRAEFRDPKVQLHDGKWMMLVQRSTDHILEIYKSDNLKDWGDAVSTFGPEGHTDGVWECPDMFPLAVDGDPDNVKWVLIVNINPGQRIIGSAAQYFVGSFDGTTFKSEAETDWVDWGMDNYAIITWDNTPDGRRVSMGWMSNWNYTELAPAGAWRNGFTVPRELKLRVIHDKIRLTQLPVSELASVRDVLLGHGDKVTITDGRLDTKIHAKAADIELVFKNVNATEFGVRVFAGDGQETLVGYSPATGEVFVDRTLSGDVSFHDKFAGRHAAPFQLDTDGSLRLRVLVDRGSVEAFAGQGEIAITDVIFPVLAKDGLDFYAKGGSAVLQTYTVWSMADIQSSFRK